MGSALARERSARLQAALAGAPFDAFLATTPENVLYASGYRSVGTAVWRDHRMAALVTEEGVDLVAPCADSAPAVDAGVPADRIIPFGVFYFEGAAGTPLAGMPGRHTSFAEAVAAALRLRRGAISRLGVDRGALEPLAAAAIDRACEPERQVDATAWALGVRAEKLPGEVELLREAARLAEAGIEAALDAAKPGVTERELAATVAATIAAGGGEPRFLVVAAGERSALADAHPTANPWEPGQLLRFDVGCAYEGYWSDVGRTAVLGEPDPLQARRYEAVLAGEEEELAAIRAGVTAGEVFDRAMAAVRGRGLVPYRRHHCGHGIGLAVYEPPIVSEGAGVPLRAGMTMCLETPFYELGWGGMMVEDTVVVTEQGHELLTSSSRDLRVVPA